MPANTKHIEYEKRESDFCTIRDSLEGQRAIKAKRSTYLPVPPGMTDGGGTSTVLASGKRVGNSRYSFYLSFAEFPELCGPVLTGFQGIIHASPPHIKLPSKMEYLLEEATPDGHPLLTLWKRVTREVISMGRIGLLLDFSLTGDKVYIVAYVTENIINWREFSPREGGGAEIVSLRESIAVQKDDDPFVMENQVRYRELRSQDGVYKTQTWTENQGTTSQQGGLVASGYTIPVYFGSPLDFIPITIINPIDSGFVYEPIPLLPLVRRCLSIYRLSADYRRSLYIKGDPQVWIAGVQENEAPEEIGGESIWTFPNPAASANYLDIDGNGIPLVRDAIKEEFDRFYHEGGKLLDSSDKAAESGEALRRRQVAQQVSLRDIAQSTGEAFELVLKKIAYIMGEDPNKVEFKPDLDFAEPNIDGQELLEIMTAKGVGAPLSMESIHGLARRGGLTNMTFEEEEKKINSEGPILPSVMPQSGVEIPNANQQQ